MLVFHACMQEVVVLVRREKEGGYLRFRNSINASGVVVTYSNPFSISCVASLVLAVALHVHSSDVARYMHACMQRGLCL